MNTSEKLCLQWNDFKDNFTSSFGELREDRDFTDVTLACEDGEQVEAHKVILAASSPFFQNLLGRNKHAHHPLIYMRGVKSTEMVAIVDFLYCGETNVLQENLDSFLTIAAELKLKGLLGPDEKMRRAKEEIDGKSFQIEPDNYTHFPNVARTGKKPKQERPMVKNGVALTERTVMSENCSLAELDEKVKSMMVQSEKAISYGKGTMRLANICKICGKEGQIVNIRDHIEANHLEGVSLPCNLCERKFRSRQSLRSHINYHHKAQISLFQDTGDPETT